MSVPFYVSPEQIIKDKADYARKGIARGRSVVVLQYRDGIVFVAENPSRALHKVSEIYDRIAFAAVGKYNEFENLRVAGIRLADLRGYSYDRRDVTVRNLANAYAQTLGTIFTETSKPYEVEIVVAEVGDDAVRRPDLPAHLRRLGRRRAGLRRHGWVGGRDHHGAGGALPARASSSDRRSRWPSTRSRRHGRHRQRRPRQITPAQLEVAVLDRTRTQVAQVQAAGGRPPRRAAAGRRIVMDRRIFGIETEYGVTCTFRGQRRLSPDEVARYLFRRVVSWGRSSNVFLRNGARLYLDVGSHPEYATPECDSLTRADRPRPRGGADPRGPAHRRRAAAARGGHRRRRLPVQEQHRLGRQLLRVPRELPDLAAG